MLKVLFYLTLAGVIERYFQSAPSFERQRACGVDDGEAARCLRRLRLHPAVLRCDRVPERGGGRVHRAAPLRDLGGLHSAIARRTQVHAQTALQIKFVVLVRPEL